MKGGRTILFGSLLFAAVAIAEDDHHDHGHGHGHGGHGHAEHEEPEPAKGPHGGKLLEDGGLVLELTIFEDNVPPVFRVYVQHDGKPVSASQVTASVVLERFHRDRQEIKLLPEADYLTSNVIVEEPHSFGVRITATYAGKTHAWSYETHEGRTELSKEALHVAQLEIGTAGPKKIVQAARVYGRLLPNENRVAHIVPRFPGIIKEIKKSLGEPVAKGEVVAVVESNQSLQRYQIDSQVAGVVIKRHGTVGEFVSDEREILVVADLSELWADFQVYRDDLAPLRPGQEISIELGGGKEVTGMLSYISPITDEATQSRLIRAILPNEKGTLRPGLFVSGTLSSPLSEAPIAVERGALQKFRDWDVVYLTDGHIFQAMPVTLGRRDAQHVEILSGLQPGDKYVSKNSFIIKADIEKSAASHDH